jgi:hypothetical protein
LRMPKWRVERRGQAMDGEQGRVESKEIRGVSRLIWI